MPSPEEWAEALASEHQREAKVIIMTQIAAARRQAWEAGRDEVIEAVEQHWPDVAKVLKEAFGIECPPRS